MISTLGELYLEFKKAIAIIIFECISNCNLVKYNITQILCEFYQACLFYTFFRKV